VKVTSQAFDELLPWLKRAETTVRGNAVVTDTRQLLTSADLIKNANLLEVRTFGRYPDYPARAVWVDYDLNLALLEVDDPAFWQGLRALPLLEPRADTGATGIRRFEINRWRANGRFEQGTGEVVEFLVSNSPYGLMEYPLLRGTTSMGALGWAEVLTAKGAVIGLLVSHEGQQLQAITGDVLRLAVEASRRGRFEGFAHRGFAWQQLNQAHLRESLGLRTQDTGVLVRRVFAGSTGAAELKSGDVLHRINGYPVDPEGRIEHPTYGLLPFTMALNESLAPTLPVEIEREGKRLPLALRRRRFAAEDYRVPPPNFDGPVDYEVFGGLVLQELSLGFLRAWGAEWRAKAPTRLTIEYAARSLREPDGPPERVVVISRVLPDPANLGYEGAANAIVRGVNGRPVPSLDALRSALRRPRGGYHEIELQPGSARARLVYAQAELNAVNARVRERYAIPEPQGR
jgi:hypothetical protein